VGIIWICMKCHRQTHPRVAVVDLRTVKARRCYAAVEKGRWTRGCAYKQALPVTRLFVDALIRGGPVNRMPSRRTPRRQSRFH